LFDLDTRLTNGHAVDAYLIAQADVPTSPFVLTFVTTRVEVETSRPAYVTDSAVCVEADGQTSVCGAIDGRDTTFCNLDAPLVVDLGEIADVTALSFQNLHSEDAGDLAIDTSTDGVDYSPLPAFPVPEERAGRLGATFLVELATPRSARYVRLSAVGGASVSFGDFGIW